MNKIIQKFKNYFSLIITNIITRERIKEKFITLNKFKENL